MEKPITPPEWDDIFPNASKQRAERETEGFLLAQKYLVFGGPTSDPRARDLLDMWTKGVRKQRIAPNASAQEFAYWNACREFIEIIHSQIELATNGPQQPKPRT